MDQTTQQQQWKPHKNFHTSWWSTNQYWFRWCQHYSKIYLQLLWSRYIFRYFIWNLEFMSVVKYTKNMSSNRTPASSVPVIKQHVSRACIQFMYLWKLSHLKLDIPDPTSWDWKLSSVSKFCYIRLWQACSLPDVHSLLKTCLCTKGSRGSCPCKKSEWTVWNFAGVKNQNVKTNFFLRTEKI